MISTGRSNGTTWPASKGQRQRIDYGNGVSTLYEYDPLTFRLVHLLTRRDVRAFPDDCSQPSPGGWPGCGVQNLQYSYDPVGNITRIRDDAQQTVYFRNRRVEPSADYTYDAIYRLIEATGREHLGQVGSAPVPNSYNDVPRVALPHPNDGNAMGTYVEHYLYDAVGNFLQMQHRGSDPANPGWTRSFAYHETSLLEADKQSNRLSSTSVGNNTPMIEPYGYDVHGNMLRMPHLQVMQWDFKDQLQMTQRQAVNADDADGVVHQGERTWYVYDSSGQRVRKVTELSTGQVKDERVYLGGFETYRKKGANLLVRETLHIMDDKQRIALVETRTEGTGPEPQQLIRYQLGNHLGSASLELDEQAQVITYEEYTPYGSTSYQAGRAVTEVSSKRYRYTGMERDEESGLERHGARYYTSWLGRWVSPDPSGLVDGPNLFLYANAKPIIASDPSGREEKQTWLMEQKGTQINPIATRVSRGITSLQREALRVLDHWFGPGKGAHWAHPPDTPFVTQRATISVPLSASPGADNMSKQNDSKVIASQADESGRFRREWDGNHSVDRTVPPGTRIKQPPPEPHVRALALFAKSLPRPTNSAASNANSIVVSPPESSPAVKLASTQLELKFEQRDTCRSTDTANQSTPANQERNAATPDNSSMAQQTGSEPAVENTPFTPEPALGAAGKVLNGAMLAGMAWSVANARSPEEVVDTAASMATNYMGSEVFAAAGGSLAGPPGYAAGLAIGAFTDKVVKDPAGFVQGTVDCVFGGYCGLPTTEEAWHATVSAWHTAGNTAQDVVDFIMNW